MKSRSSFLLGCAALAVNSLRTEALAADGALGHLDHSFWIVTDASGAKDAFRRLGFTLTPKALKQPGGALSTFAFFRDRTYLEIVEDHSASSLKWVAGGANPEEAGGFVVSCKATVAAVAQRGVKMTLDQDGGFCEAGFPQASILSNVFVYSYPLDESEAARKKSAQEEAPLIKHANGALGLLESWIAVPDLPRALARFTGVGFPVIAPAVSIEPLGAHGSVLGWGAQRILLLTPSGPTSAIGAALARLGPHPVGVRLAAEMSAARQKVAPLAQAWGDALLVGPANAHGGWIAFGADGTWTA